MTTALSKLIRAGRTVVVLAPLGGLLGCASRGASEPPVLPMPERQGPAPPPAPLPAPAPATEARRVPAEVSSSIHVALGIPTDADDADDYLASREQFVMSYNARLNVPNWVAWHLDERDLGRTKRTPGFHSDIGLPKAFYVVRDQDYVGSGYDRGHLCPSADRTLSPSTNLATFVLSNTHPQLHALNAGPWEKLEVREREWARAGKELFVVAGGLFEPDPQRIGKERDPARRLAVPTASYKIIVVVERGQRAAELGPSTPVVAVVMPNRTDVDGHGFEEYETTVREVERQSGYDFLNRLPTALQEVLETKPAAHVATTSTTSTKASVARALTGE